MATFNGFTIIPVPSTPPAPKSIEWSVPSIVSVTTSPFTAQQQIQDWQASWMELSLSYPPMSNDTAQAWISFIMLLRGSANIFQFGDPRMLAPRGSGLGTPLVDGGAQTGYSLATKGWTAGSAGVLLAGDWLQIGFRLYKNLVDANADGSGKATLSISPPIRESPLNNTAINLTNTKGVFRLKQNAQRWMQSTGGLYTLTFEAREAI